jgi:hypothetical protein
MAQASAGRTELFLTGARDMRAAADPVEEAAWAMLEFFSESLLVTMLIALPLMLWFERRRKAKVGNVS